MWKYKNNVGKSNPKKLSKEKRSEIFASEEITNVRIKIKYAKEIKEAKQVKDG